MSNEERWQLVHEDVTLFAPEIMRGTTPDEFLTTESTAIPSSRSERRQQVPDIPADEWTPGYGQRWGFYNPKPGSAARTSVRAGDPPTNSGPPS